MDCCIYTLLRLGFVIQTFVICSSKAPPSDQQHQNSLAAVIRKLPSIFPVKSLLNCPFWFHILSPREKYSILLAVQMAICLSCNRTGVSFQEQIGQTREKHPLYSKAFGIWLKRAEPFKSRSQTASSLPTSCIRFAQAPHGLCTAAAGQLVWMFFLFTHRSLTGARMVRCLGSQTGSWYMGWYAEVSAATAEQPGTSYQFLSGSRQQFHLRALYRGFSKRCPPERSSLFFLWVTSLLASLSPLHSFAPPPSLHCTSCNKPWSEP